MSRILSLLAVAYFASAVVGRAAAPALREQISLNGEWLEGGVVPQYGGADVSRQTYRRRVAVPSQWVRRRIYLEFRQVNYITDVYMDDRHVANHVGGWVPFTVDVTAHATAGSEFELRVEVQSGAHRPHVDEQNKPLWPVGTYQYPGDSYTSHRLTGISDDVWLRASGEVAIDDAYIRTSFRKRRISIDYTLTNHGPADRTVVVRAEITAAAGGSAVKNMVSKPVLVRAGATATASIEEPWADAQLWMPDRPALYHLRSHIATNGREIDAETRRFGFREIWTEGNQFMLNGVRLNLLGDSIVTAGWRDTTRLRPDLWPSTVDMLMNHLNMRVIRWHQHPGNDHLIETADEKGLLIIDESALYGMQYYAVNDERLVENTIREWIPAWIRARRNHPSIVMWSAQNEMGYCENRGVFNHRRLLGEQLLRLSDAIRQHDPTRPITHAGDWCVGVLDSTASIHYPEGYEQLHTGSIYKYARYVFPHVPTGVGEFLACRWIDAMKPDVYWQHGTVVRGVRYSNFNDIRPFTMHWAWSDEQVEARQNLSNSFAKVALFDKEYDDLGIAPLLHKRYPAVPADTRQRRTLVLYNDEYRDTAVMVEVALRADGQVLGTARTAVNVRLGEHIEIDCEFAVPAAASREFDLVLATSKGGVRKFQEARRFRVEGEPVTKPSTVITLAPRRPSS